MSGDKRKQTAQQRLNNFLRSPESKKYNLCPIKIGLLHAIASYCYYKNDCNPSYKAISDYSGVKNRDTLRDHFTEIHEMGLLFITKKMGRNNHYLWLIPDIEDKEIYSKKDCG